MIHSKTIGTTIEKRKMNFKVRDFTNFQKWKKKKVF